VVARDPPGTPPFAAEVWRYRSVPGAFDRPRELARAELIVSLLARFPGYTIRDLLTDDAQDLYWTAALLNPDLGKAPDDQ
jgi:hypothetical protein